MESGLGRHWRYLGWRGTRCGVDSVVAFLTFLCTGQQANKTFNPGDGYRTGFSASVLPSIPDQLSEVAY